MRAHFPAQRPALCIRLCLLAAIDQEVIGLCHPRADFQSRRSCFPVLYRGGLCFRPVRFKGRPRRSDTTYHRRCLAAEPSS